MKKIDIMICYSRGRNGSASSIYVWTSYFIDQLLNWSQCMQVGKSLRWGKFFQIFRQRSSTFNDDEQVSSSSDIEELLSVSSLLILLSSKLYSLSTWLLWPMLIELLTNGSDCSSELTSKAECRSSRLRSDTIFENVGRFFGSIDQHSSMSSWSALGQFCERKQMLIILLRFTCCMVSSVFKYHGQKLDPSICKYI